MGSVHHHQTEAKRFLSLARSDHNAGNYARAANALARAASHAATAANFHRGLFRRPTRRRLTSALFMLAGEGHLSNGSVRAFRRIYDLPEQLWSADPGQRQQLTRRARNRVADLIRAVMGLISSHPVTGRGRRPYRPPPPPIPQSVREIMDLPNYRDIAAAHNLQDAPLGRRPDPHGFYDRGKSPPPCPCHPVSAKHDMGNTIDLSPLWKRALEKTFRTPFPDTLPLHGVPA